MNIHRVVEELVGWLSPELASPRRDTTDQLGPRVCAASSEDRDLASGLSQAIWSTLGRPL
jgi:hypothetical protein